MTVPDTRPHVPSGGDLRHVPAPGERGQHTATRAPSWRDAVQALQVIAQAATDAAEVLADLEKSSGIQLAVARERAVMGPVPSETPKPLLSARALAIRLDVDPKTIRRWREGGKLPAAIDVAGVLRWRPAVIDAWLLEQEEIQP